MCKFKTALFATIISLLTMFVASGALAADIAGLVNESASNKPAVGAVLRVTCGSLVKTANTNQFGRYRISDLPDTTWCQLEIQQYAGSQSNQIQINTGSGSKDVNLQLQRDGNQWKLN